MKKLITGFILLLLSVTFLPAQNTLYDDSRICSIKVTIHPDSLAWIMDNVLSDHYFMAQFIFDDGENIDTLENIGFRLRGNTSRYARKKSFKISFNEYVSGRKFQGVKKVNLNGEHNDPTLIREKLFYDFWKKAGMPERRTSFVKLYINGTYYGLYTNLEEMEKEWVTRVFPNNNGNLYKCTYPADLVYLGPDQQTYKDLQNSTATGGRVYELQTNKSQDDYSRLVALITALNHTPDTGFIPLIDGILNVNGFLKALALDVATGNWDDYSYNRNNYYLYDNPATGQFEFIAYDPDNTCGVDWMGIDWGTRNCLSWVNNTLQLPLAQKLLAVPSFFDRYKLFLDTIARRIILPDSSFAHISLLKQLITEAAVADTFRCLDYGYTIDDFHNGFLQGIDNHTPYGILPFLSTRYTAILNQLYPSGTGDLDGNNRSLLVYPNPTREAVSWQMINTSPGRFEGSLIDHTGRVVRSYNGETTPDQLQQMEFGDLPSGLYLLRIEQGGTTHTKRVIKL